MNGLFLGVAFQSAQVGGETQKPMHCHVGIAGRVFRQVTDEALGRQRVLDDIKAADGDAARGRWIKARDDAHSGRFAGAVRPQKPQHLAALDGKRDIVDSMLCPERFHQIFDFDHYGTSAALTGHPVRAILVFATMGSRPCDFRPGADYRPPNLALSSRCAVKPGLGDAESTPPRRTLLRIDAPAINAEPDYRRFSGAVCIPRRTDGDDYSGNPFRKYIAFRSVLGSPSGPYQRP